MRIETLLVLVLWGFYLADCIMLLATDEALLCRGAGGFRAVFGLRGWRLAGREPVLCNPLLPFESVHRLRWAMAGAPPDAQLPPLPALPPVPAPALAFLALNLLVLAPACVLARPGSPAWLVPFALGYAGVVGLLFHLRRHWAGLGLAPASFNALAFEVLACAPRAVNLRRRVALLQGWDADFVLAARRHLPPAALPACLQACRERLDEQLDTLDPGTAAHTALLAARHRLEEPPLHDDE